MPIPVLDSSCQNLNLPSSAFLKTPLRSYVLLHASRKTFSNVKVSILAQWTPAPQNRSGPALSPGQTWNENQLFADETEATLFLGALDTVFLFSYAVVVLTSSRLLVNPVCLSPCLCSGLYSSSSLEFLFGTLTEWLHFYNVYFYCALWVLNGLLQSAVWPCVVAVMGNWFGMSGRGFVFGLWSACASVGNILGAFLASSVLCYGYEYAFLVTSSVQFAGGVIVFFGLLTSPKEIGEWRHKLSGLIPVGRNRLGSSPLRSPQRNRCCTSFPMASHRTLKTGRVSFDLSRAPDSSLLCLLPPLQYSLAYACLKLVNYSFFFWLPFYLSNNFGWEEAESDRLSIWYDVGGIVGGTVQGLISDFMGKRAPVLAVSLLLAMGSLVGYSRSPNDQVVNAVILAVTGFFIGGPSNMISSAISADLGRQEALRGSQEALATVTGIVDGTGSMGAAAGQYLVSLIESRLGWMCVFYFFIVMTFGSVLFISPLIVSEVRSMIRERRLRSHQL
uniref:Sugar phosphate exchanger 3 n=1 Tax=Lepisosteus oculatus TaxID=7918 RepID=W5NKF5_LEPOC